MKKVKDNQTYEMLIFWTKTTLLGKNRSWCFKHWWRRRGCNRIPKTFDFVKIRAKSVRNLGKICENVRKAAQPFFWKSCFYLVLFGQVKWNMGKFGEIWAKKVLEVCFDFNEMQSFFWKSFSLEFFSGKFGEIWAKILRTPKIFLLLHLWLQA